MLDNISRGIFSSDMALVFKTSSLLLIDGISVEADLNARHLLTLSIGACSELLRVIGPLTRTLGDAFVISRPADDGEIMIGDLLLVLGGGGGGNFLFDEVGLDGALVLGCSKEGCLRGPIVTLLEYTSVPNG